MKSRKNLEANHPELVSPDSPTQLYRYEPPRPLEDIQADIRKLEVYKAIQRVRDSGMNMTGWLEFYTDGLATQMREVTEKGTRIIKRDLLVRKHGLNGRQQRILMRLMENAELTIQDFEQEQPEMNRRTLQRDLKRLIACGVVATKGHTHKLVYMLESNAL